MKFKIGDIAIIIQDNYLKKGSLVKIINIGSPYSNFSRPIQAQSINRDDKINDVFSEMELDLYPVTDLERIIYDIKESST